MLSMQRTGVLDRSTSHANVDYMQSSIRMKFAKQSLSASVLTLLVCCASTAQTIPAAVGTLPSATGNYSPYYAKVGASIFVSGPLQFWAASLFKEFNQSNTDVERVVFVNATSTRPEVVGSEVAINRQMRSKNITTVVVGRCDLWCSRLFIGGKVRQFGQDLQGQKTHLDIQVPIDYATKALEPRFPNTQWAIYERNEPKLNAYKSVFYEALTEGGMTGGLHIYGDQPAQFCLTRSPDSGCKAYEASAFGMGVTTQPARVSITLPEQFPAPLPSGFADINDVSAVPPRGQNSADDYRKFLEFPIAAGRFFAISEDTNGATGRSWGDPSPEGDAPTRAIKRCETASKSKCRMYAVNDKVVWRIEPGR